MKKRLLLPLIILASCSSVDTMNHNMQTSNTLIQTNTQAIATSAAMIENNTAEVKLSTETLRESKEVIAESTALLRTAMTKIDEHPYLLPAAGGAVALLLAFPSLFMVFSHHRLTRQLRARKEEKPKAPPKQMKKVPKSVSLPRPPLNKKLEKRRLGFIPKSKMVP